MRIESSLNYNDLKLTITDDNNNPLVKAFLNCAAAENTFTKKLNDNPYQLDQLKNIKRNYNIIITKNGLPYYGHFLTQYPELPSNVARIFSRAYKTKLFDDKLSKGFWKAESQAYQSVLAPLLIRKNIDTLFWTRHSDSVGSLENKWLNMCSYFGYDLSHKESILFKGIKQNIHYFKVWGSPNSLNNNFLEYISNVK